MTSTTPAMNGTADHRRNAISDSPTTARVPQASSAKSSWLSAGPARISLGPFRT